MEKKEKENMRETEESIEANKIENNKYVLEQINSWINNADSKVGMACGITSVVMAVIAIIAESILGEMDTKNLNLGAMSLFYLFLIVASVTFVISLSFYFLAINPSLISGQSDIEGPKYSIFFKDIAKFQGADALMESYKEASLEDFNKELIREIYMNSGICTDKMKYFKKGMWISVIAVFSAILSCVLFYLATIL